MLKPVEPGPDPERPIGELIHELIEEAKGYARAEIGLARVIAGTKAKALALPAALFAAALLVALAAVSALAFGALLALSRFLGPLLAGVAGLLIFAGVAAGLGWYGYQRLRRDL